MKLDQTDIAILDLLVRDGRMSNREIARTLDISEGMVRQRLKKQIESKATRLGLVSDIEASGMLAAAVVRIKTEPDRVTVIATELARLDACKFVGLMLGRYDIMVYVLGRNRLEVAALIDQSIASLPGIVSMDIREPIGSAKHRYDLTWII